VGGAVHSPYVTYILKLFPLFSIYKESFVNEYMPYKAKWLRHFISSINRMTDMDYITFLMKNVEYENSKPISDLSEYELLGHYAFNNFKDEINISDLKLLRPVNKFIFEPSHINYFKDYLSLKYDFLGYR
jgi:hypothetical protein